MNRLNERTFVADTRTARGRGLFAVDRICAGEILSTSDESWELRRKEMIQELPRRFQVLCCEFEHDERYIICPIDFENPPFSHLVNHSCDPNMASTDNYDTLIALRDIQASEEITFDYATFNVTIDAFVCACRATRCRGIITGNDWTILELQERYRGYFQKNIQDKIDALKQRTEDVTPTRNDSASIGSVFV